jgi:GntR family transcriptional regulator of vanillate catabolism
VIAQDHHRQALDAITRREGARAEAIMREHSRITRRNLLAAVQSPGLEGLPGVGLIRRRSGVVAQEG